MPDIQKTLNLLHSKKAKQYVSTLYGTNQETIIGEQIQRYQNLVRTFGNEFSDGDIQLFSTPGRTEIGGNHTDHNAGKVIAAGVHLDSIAAAVRTDDHQIIVRSEGYPELFQVDLNSLEPIPSEEGNTAALIRGIAARFHQLGYNIGGFRACITSDVGVGSGLSSSASVEVLIANIFNALYNDNTIPAKTMAIIGQYAENGYFGKPCGLMDQLTCAVGGIVTIDFKDADNPVLKKIDFDFNQQDVQLLVVDTGGSHAELTSDYAAVPQEMKTIARMFNGNVLRDIEIQDVLDNIKALRNEAGDRAILRALHYFNENQRVDKQVAALEDGDFDTFLQLVAESGNASWKWLQNCYSTRSPYEQGVPLALALTENYLSQNEKGACRVHGGGFAGTVQVFMPNALLDEYVRFMKGVFGEHAVRILNIRPVGAVHLDF